MRTCHSCNAPMHDDQVFCGECGASFKPQERACPKCGCAMSDDQVFCGECGASFNPQERACPKCGCAMSDDQAFCGECGARVRDTSATAARARPPYKAIIAVAACIVVALTAGGVIVGMVYTAGSNCTYSTPVNNFQNGENTTLPITDNGSNNTSNNSIFVPSEMLSFRNPPEKTAYCADCEGTGVKICNVCNGVEKSCGLCGGNGARFGISCLTCYGEGKEICYWCQGRGSEKCNFFEDSVIYGQCYKGTILHSPDYIRYIEDLDSAAQQTGNTVFLLDSGGYIGIGHCTACKSDCVSHNSSSGKIVNCQSCYYGLDFYSATSANDTREYTSLAALVDKSGDTVRRMVEALTPGANTGGGSNVPGGNAGGGSDPWVTVEDKCRTCYGGGRCKTCNGSGWATNPYVLGERGLCSTCGGLGHCTGCSGTGLK